MGLFCVILGLFPFELSGTLWCPRRFHYLHNPDTIRDPWAVVDFDHVRHQKSRSRFASQPSWRLSKERKRKKIFWYPKWMSRLGAPTPRGLISTLEVLDGVSFYRLLTHVFQVLINLPPPKVISGLLSNIQKVGLFCVILCLFPFELSGTLWCPRRFQYLCNSIGDIFVPKNCTILVCRHPLIQASPPGIAIRRRRGSSGLPRTGRDQADPATGWGRRVAGGSIYRMLECVTASKRGDGGEGWEANLFFRKKK